MGLEEIRAIQEFVSDHGWIPISKIAFNSYGNGYFKAKWGNDVAHITLDVNGVLHIAAKESLNTEPKAFFRCSLAEPDCLERLSLALMFLWD